MQMKYYKKGEGELVRWVAGGLIGLLVIFGAVSLFQFLPYSKDTGGIVLEQTVWSKPLFEVPFLEFAISIRLLIAFFVGIGGLLLTYLLVVNYPKAADFLIETEGEMKKVSWPSRAEYIGSSLAVIVMVGMIGLFLLGADNVLFYIMKWFKIT